MAAKKRTKRSKPAAKAATSAAAVMPDHPSPAAMARREWDGVGEASLFKEGVRAERERMVAFLRGTPAADPLPGEVWRGKAAIEASRLRGVSRIGLRDVQAAVVIVDRQPRAAVLTGDGWSEGMDPQTRAAVFAAYVMDMATLADDLEGSLR